MRQYSWVMVDEAQDLSAAQLAIVIASLKKTGRLVAVGDPDQSIYGFTGADPWSFQSIGSVANNDFPLSICYRCPSSVIDLARKIVPAIEPRSNAPKGVVLQVHSITKMLRSKDMVICRRNAPLMVECLKAIADGKNAYIRGAELKDSLIDLVDSVTSTPGHTWKSFDADIRIAQMNAINKLLNDGEDESAERIGDLFDAVIGIYENKKPLDVINMKAIIASMFEETPESIIFSSIHRAKGLEADRVFLIDAGKVRLRWKGQKPWQEFQEQCCEYVALTRPKAELYLMTEDGSQYKVGKPSKSI
jgi:superfamily I DNA/RNA helicase